MPDKRHSGDSPPVIIERTPGEKLAYIQGMRAGLGMAAREITRHLEVVQQQVDALEETINAR